VDKRAVTTWLARNVMNPLARPVVGHVPGWALLETTGRRSGRPIRNPVGDGLRGDTFWIVAEHGRRSHYVRNIVSNQRVRVRTHGRWRTGRAQVLPNDDPRARLRWLGGVNAFVVRLMGTDLLTVRIDLDQ
jgi:deazaflavin-dependent oxidoreductase (nitroreductase family)